MLCYRHTVPIDAQRLRDRLEIRRWLRTASFAVAVHRLPNVVARIEIEIEPARTIAGVSVDTTLIRPLQIDLAERAIEAPPPPNTDVQPDKPLMLERREKQRGAPTSTERPAVDGEATFYVTAIRLNRVPLLAAGKDQVKRPCLSDGRAGR